MITPAEIRKKAERQYSTFLSAVLLRTPFFPFHIKGNKGKASDSYEKLFRDITRLLESEKQKIGYGYTVTLKKVNTRQAGKISMPDTIFFENVEDYIKFIDKEKEFLVFQKAVRQTHKRIPELKAWMAKEPLKVIKHLSIWENLLEVCEFFLENPTPNIYAREISTSTTATFIESHQKILTELLDALQLANNSSSIFEERYGLKYDVPLIRVRNIQQFIASALADDISLSIEDWNKLALSPKCIFIITDRLDFLRFPKNEGALIILGTTEVLMYLDKLSFIKDTQIYFWSDLSVQSVTQLSLVRVKFPNTKSFLMNIELLETYKEAVQIVKVKKKEIIPHLTPQEQALLMELQKGKQLLQKHIQQEEIEIALESLN